MDSILINELRINATVGPDRWNKERPQPVIVSLEAHTSLEEVGKSDDLQQSIDYSMLCKKIMSFTECPSRSFQSLILFADVIADLLLKESRINSVLVNVDAPNNLLHADCLSVSVRVDQEHTAISREVAIKKMLAKAIIGVNPAERINKQNIFISLSIDFTSDDNSPLYMLNWQEFHSLLINAIEETSFFTIEALATAVARLAWENNILDRNTQISVLVEKPKALMNAASSAVSITRNRQSFAENE